MKTPYKLPTLYCPAKGRWLVFYSVLDPDTEKYVRFQVYIPSSCKTDREKRSAAKKIISELTEKLKNGLDPLDKKPRNLKTISQAITYILEVKEKTLRKRTFGTYKSMLKQFQQFLRIRKIEDLEVSRFSKGHAWQFMDWLKAEKHITNRTYNYRRMHMKTLFNLLKVREWITENPFGVIEKLPVEDTSINAFSVQDLRIMQQNLPVWDYNLYCVACLVFYCFLRPQEIMRLKVKHIDFDHGQIILPGYVSKNRKSETVMMPDGLKEILKKLSDLEGDGERLLFTRNLARGYKEAAPTRIAEKWRLFANFYGIEKNIYALKHTGVGMAVDAGCNLRDLQIQIRHYSLEQTQQYLNRFRRTPSEQLRKRFPSLTNLPDTQLPEETEIPMEITLSLKSLPLN